MPSALGGPETHGAEGSPINYHFPVLLGLAISGLFAVQSHFLAVSALVPTWTAQDLLAILFGFSYINARDLGPRWWPQRA